MNNQGIIFLNKIYSELVNNDVVKHTIDIARKHDVKVIDKNDAVSKYLNRIDKISKDSLKHDNMRHVKNMYYKKYVVKKEDIPESYFELQKKIALEKGYGYLEYTKEIKEREIEILINEQKESLDRWIEYFASSDTDHYETWFKYFTFQGIIKIGYYDKEKEVFTKRTNKTVKPFIEINREAIAMMYDVMKKTFNKENVEDKLLLELINNGNFSKIYAYCIKKLGEVNKDNTNSTEGIWKKYKRGSDPNILFNDIHGKGTGWCTAGGVETATAHINGGDFYVYYTKDKEGEFTCPRIAIRMENYNIAEVRGISSNQNLESNMEIVVKEKLKEFPDGETYQKKVKDMEYLTLIYNKCQGNDELTRDDLIFLYEINDKIKGFGYSKDPRIGEILYKRDKRQDLACIFECKEENITTSKKEYEDATEPIIFHQGDLDLSDIEKKEIITLPKIINGCLNLGNLKSCLCLNLPTKVNGDLDLSSLETIENLVLPKEVNGDLDLSSLETMENLMMPTKVNGDLDLSSLETIENLVLPKEVNGDLDLSSLETMENLMMPTKVSGDLNLSGLETIESLVLPEIIRGDVILNELRSARKLKFSDNVKGDILLNSLIQVEELILPNIMYGNLNLGSLETIESLVLPKEINGDLILSGLVSAEGLDLSNLVNRGDIDLSNLKSLEGLLIHETMINEIVLPFGLKLTDDNIIREISKKI